MLSWDQCHGKGDRESERVSLWDKLYRITLTPIRYRSWNVHPAKNLIWQLAEGHFTMKKRKKEYGRQVARMFRESNQSWAHTRAQTSIVYFWWSRFVTTIHQFAWLRGWRYSSVWIIHKCGNVFHECRPENHVGRNTSLSSRNFSSQNSPHTNEKVWTFECHSQCNASMSTHPVTQHGQWLKYELT